MKNMRRKIIAIVLILCMLFTMSPSINELLYGIFEHQVKAAEGDPSADELFENSLTVYEVEDTIQNVIKTIESSDEKQGLIKLNAGVKYSENLVISKGATIVIDLNGATIAPVTDASGGTANNITVYGKVTIKNSGSEGSLSGAGVSNARGMLVASGAEAKVRNVKIESYNVNGNGAGILAEDEGNIKLENSTITKCTSNGNGAAMFVYDSRYATIIGSELSENNAVNGAGLFFYKSIDATDKHIVEITDSKFIKNYASKNGGGIYSEYSIYIKLSGETTFDENSAELNGGGIFCLKNSTIVAGDKVSICNNRAEAQGTTSLEGNGGGICILTHKSLDGANIILNGTKLNGNYAGRNGGAICCGETATATDSDAIPAKGLEAHVLTFTNVQMTGNQSGNQGGAVYTYNKSKVTINEGTYSGNKALSHGGFIYVSSTSDNSVSSFELNGGTISENSLTATNNTRNGGAVYIGGYAKVDLNKGLINKNYNAFNGGGIYIGEGSNVKIHAGIEMSENTVKGFANTANGGAFYLANSASFEMDGGVFRANGGDQSAVCGGAMYLGNGNSVISGGLFEKNYIANNSGSAIRNGGKLTITGDTKLLYNKFTGSADGYGTINGGTVNLMGNVEIAYNEIKYAAAVNADNVDISGNVDIHDNKANSVGAIRVSGEFKMSGGKIHDNKALNGNCGALYFNRNTGRVFEISGGQIYNNTATGNGGAIFMDGPVSPTSTMMLKISGTASITGNEANRGGAIYTTRCSRVLIVGGEIVNNKANGNEAQGGGIYMESSTSHSFGDGSKYALEIKGGKFKDNSALVGNDIFVSASNPTDKYQRPYISLIKPSEIGSADSVWVDENTNEEIKTAVDTTAKVNAQTEGYNYKYTFCDRSAPVAKVGTRKYGSVQAAINDIVSGKTSGNNNIVLIDNSRENVVVPSGLTATLDLAGFKLYGASKSVITVEKNATFTVKDTSEDQSGMITEGKGTVSKENNGTNYYGGGVFVSGTFNFESGNIYNNGAKYGSAIYIANGGVVNITGGVIEKNHSHVNNKTNFEASTILAYYTAQDVAGSNGGATLNISKATIKNNVGRGVYATGYDTKVTIKASEISGNRSSGNGAGLLLDNGRNHTDEDYANTVTDTKIIDNYTTGNGGGVYIASTSDYNPADYSKKGYNYFEGCTIENNTGANGGGMFIYNGLVEIKKTLITDNVAATGDGGGIFVDNRTKARLYANEGFKVYGNNARAEGKDLRFYWSKATDVGLFENFGSTVDYRAVENMGVDGIQCWYDPTKDAYYVQDDKVPADTKGFKIYSISSMLYNAAAANVNDHRLNNNYSLVASYLPAEENAVAQIGDKKYPTLSSAISAANSLATDESKDVTILLLKDITESVTITKRNANITLNLQGHTIMAPLGASNVFYINGGNIRLIDKKMTPAEAGVTEVSDEYNYGTGKIVPSDKGDISRTRCVFLYDGSFILDEGVTISGFNITADAGNDGDGAAIYQNFGVNNISTKLEIRGGVIENCQAIRYGGAIFFSTKSDSNYKSSFIMTGGIIRNNYAANHGGAIYFNNNNANARSTIEISGGKFEGNNTKTNGGAIYVAGSNVENHLDDVKIYGATFEKNYALSYGGAIFATTTGNKTYPFILGKEGTETVFKGNYTANANGGAVYIDGSDKKPDYVVLDSVLFDSNYSGNESGALTSNADNFVMKNCTFKNNKSRKYGAAYISSYNFEIDGCEFDTNDSQDTAGALAITYRNRSLTYTGRVLKNTVFHDNTSIRAGGLYLTGMGDILVDNCTFYDNTSYGAGGAITVNGTDMAQDRTYTFKNCKIYENTANTDGGGAISAYQVNGLTLVIDGCLIENNIAKAGSGGAISLSRHNVNHPNHLIIKGNTKITGHSSNGNGGAIYLSNWSFTLQDNAEISNNTSNNEGGAIYFYHDDKNTNAVDMNFNINGGIIKNNTAKNNGGGVRTYTNAQYGTTNVTISGGQIIDNKTLATDKNGGGLFINTSSNLVAIKVRVTGGKISGNKTAQNGGGIYVGDNANDVIISGSALITGNTAAKYGGGVFVTAKNTSLILDNTGKIYSNTATLGQDVYGESGAPNISLISATTMLGNVEELIGDCWIDEASNKTYTADVKLKPLAKAYPLTLQYHSNKIVAVVGDKAFTSVQDAINEAYSLPNHTGTVILVDNAEESVSIPAEANIRLNLNGYKISGIGVSALYVRGNVDIVDEKTSATAQGVTYEPGTKPGTITGNAAIAGGGIYVDGGCATLLSGQISDCLAGSGLTTKGYGGAGVAVYSGKFVLAGGKICDNTAQNGAAVLVSGESAVFSMTGGEICNNNSINGGAVYNAGGRVVITGGKIHDNTANYGAALYNDLGSTSINGSGADKPLIYNNSAINRGGALYVKGGSIILGESSVYSNKTTAVKSATLNTADGLSTSGGGAIFVEGGDLNVNEGALITGNSAVRGGAIYQRAGKVNILGGTITGNTAELGGGIAQNPLVAGTLNFSSGAVYGNTTLATSSGNDFYSAWEAASSYDKSSAPSMTLLASSAMGLPKYNVWKDDTYAGDQMAAAVITQGLNVTGMINKSDNVQLTAAYYNTKIESSIDNCLHAGTISISKEGTADAQPHDGVGKFDVAANSGYDDASSAEVFAKDLLRTGEATYSDDTYTINGENLRYIVYQGKKYEQDQAVRWWPGNDSRSDNNIVRTYDELAYVLDVGLSYDGKKEDMKDSYTVKVWAEYILQCNSNEAEFVTKDNGMESFSVIPDFDENGNEIQILRGYYMYTGSVDEISAAAIMHKNVTIKVYGMKNGDTLKPSFAYWVEGNDNSANYVKAESKIQTISAAPRYNISIAENPELNYTSHFDLLTRKEISESDAAGNPNAVLGAIFGYGITVMMYNEPSDKGMKGLEIPRGPIEFDLNFKGSLYKGDEKIDNIDLTPYIWAYKENTKDTKGKYIGSSEYIVNMDWTDVDELQRNTHYAYQAAPLNSGGGSNGCYNGGSWDMSLVSDDSNEIVTHVKINGYDFNSDANPTKNADGSDNNIIKTSNVKAFSAGYVEVLIPVDSADYEDVLTGYIKASVDSAVTNLNVTSVSGYTPEQINQLYESKVGLSGEAKEKDLNALIEGYFGKNSGVNPSDYAKNEARYVDNHLNFVKGLNVSSDGSGTNLYKYNHFDRGTDSGIRITDEDGKGDAPLGTDVYIEGGASYGSTMFRVDDPNDQAHYELDKPYYDSQYFANQEYYYLTAYNILQKFDASVFTPYGTEAIINKRYEQKGQKLTIDNDAFVISTTESATDWDKNQTVTTSYNLTILYAAKPDGENWLTPDCSSKYGEEYGTYNDGGQADMAKYKEENLIYFATMDDLKTYFAAQGKDGKCVAILYEFRDCCIRTGRMIVTKAKVKVSNDFKYTGKTYCTTNDVRGWVTYRPFYKMDRTNGTLADKIYGFDWATYSYPAKEYPETNEKGEIVVNGEAVKNGEININGTIIKYRDVDVYGAGLTSGETYTKIPEYTSIALSGNTNSFDGFINRSTDHYWKTEYRNGSRIPESHSGYVHGNTILLYTIDTSININTKDLQTGSNKEKDIYRVDQGERIAEFKVIPTINIASAAKKTHLAVNGTQKASISIELDIPKKLTYVPGSVVFDYDARDEGTKEKLTSYKEGALDWQIEVINNPDGTQKLIIKTDVSNIDMGLPAIYFKTDIGDVLNPANDVVNNDALRIDALIKAKYEEKNVVASETHKDNKTITIRIESSDGISESIDDTLVDIGETIKFNLRYGNHKENTITNIELGDVLPYNGDGRGTAFDGGYRVNYLAIQFSDEDTYNSFLSSNSKVMYKKGEKNSSDLGAFGAVMYDVLSNGTALTVKSQDSANKIIVFNVPDDMVTLATDDSGIGLYSLVEGVRGNQRFVMTVGISAKTQDDGNELISCVNGDRSPVQIGENVYDNIFFYRTKSEDSSAALASNKVEASVVKREINGTVFMDMNQDGIYDSKEIAEIYKEDIEKGDRPEKIIENPIQNVTVYLYEANWNEATKEVTFKLDADGNPVRAKNVLGIEYAPAKTDENGKYSFGNAPAGYYITVFKDDANEYLCDGKRPVDFERLTVTTDEFRELDNGNRSYAVAKGGSNGTKLDSANLYTAIYLPDKDKIEYNTYVSPNWNLGLYYTEYTLEKQWRNMWEGMTSEFRQLKFEVVGEIQKDGHNVGLNPQFKAEVEVNHILNEQGILTGLTATFKGGYATGEIVDDKPVYDEKFNELYEISIGADGKITYKSNGVLVEEADAKFKLQENGIPNIIWDLNMKLQAANSNGKMVYKVTEMKNYSYTEKLLTDDFVVKEKDVEDEMSKAITHKTVNQNKLYYFNIEKFLYVDTYAHGGNAKDPGQRALFKIERFDSKEDADNGQQAKDVFYTDMSCTTAYTVPAEGLEYTVDDASVKINGGKVTTANGYVYSFKAYKGNAVIRVYESGWYRISEVTDWSETDYDYVEGSNIYKGVESENLEDPEHYSDALNDINTKYVSFEIEDVYDDELGFYGGPTAQFSNVESEFDYRSSQAYAENVIKK